MQQGEPGESCEEKVICIQSTDSEPSGQESSDSLSEEGSGNYDYSDGDGSGVKSVQNQIDFQSQEEEEEEDEENTETSSNPVIVSPMCESDREFFLSFNYEWIPRCDCHGFYEPVQCWVKGGQLECWCSTRTGSIIGNTRTIISCTDPEQL